MNHLYPLRSIFSEQHCCFSSVRRTAGSISSASGSIRMDPSEESFMRNSDRLTRTPTTTKTPKFHYFCPINNEYSDSAACEARFQAEKSFNSISDSSAKFAIKIAAGKGSIGFTHVRYVHYWWFYCVYHLLCTACQKNVSTIRNVDSTSIIKSKLDCQTVSVNVESSFDCERLSG